MKLWRNPRWLTVLAVVVVGGSFYGGMITQRALNHSSIAAASRGDSAGPGEFGQGGFTGARRGGVFGTVQSLSGSTMMVSGRAGTTTVSLANNPSVLKSDGSQGAVSDIATGETVIVRGSAGSDGTVTATSIRINPSFSGGASGVPPSGSGSTDSDNSGGGASDGAATSGI